MSPAHQHQQDHEENTDPFLELEPQTLYHHEHDNDRHSHNHNTREHGHGHVNEDDIDPSLHEDRISQGSGSRTTTNRLTDFASHILGSQDGDHHDNDLDHHNEHDHEHEHTHEAGHGHELSFTGEGGVLESSNHGFHVIDHDHDRDHEIEEEVDEGEFEPHLEEGHEEEGEFVGETPGPQSLVLPPASATGRVGRKRGAYGKRKRTGGDEIVIKKQNHKEVERKRRNNISEGIDQLVIQMGIPELEKAGKSIQLRRASEWMAELGERVGGLEKEVGDLRAEKLDLEANLALTSQRYTEEHERCTRYETLWRDAQDREAKGQFEIAQLLDEISQLRAKR